MIVSVKSNAFAFGNGATELHVHFFFVLVYHTLLGKEVRVHICLIDIFRISVANTKAKFICAKRSREHWLCLERERKKTREKALLYFHFTFGNV